MIDNKKIPVSSNSFWGFETDKVCDYAFVDNFFTPEECKKIIEIGEKRILTVANVVNKNELKEARKSNISWLYPQDNMDWAYKRLTDAITVLNNSYFNFDLFGFSEGMQFTKYESPLGFYGPHVDKNYENNIRKLSITIQLSSPEEYEGGELALICGEPHKIMEKQQGKLITFPSYVLHEVKPVTKGIRYSLVAWITGKQFK
jgi:PKHD-type hydroxylase